MEGQQAPAVSMDEGTAGAAATGAEAGTAAATTAAAAAAAASASASAGTAEDGPAVVTKDGGGKAEMEEGEMDDNMLLAESHVSEKEVQSQELIELVAKWRGEEIDVGPLPGHCTLHTVKVLLEAKTRVRPEKQKLIGLTLAGGKGKQPAPDGAELAALNLAGKRPFRFILMGTPEEEVFVDPSARDDLPEVFDDFELEASALSEEWRRSVQNSENLKKFTAKTAVHLINPPRPGKRLLVLDLDHTLLDFSDREEALQRLSVTEVVRRMKRPHLDAFLAAVYPHYDLVAWSQTSWRWLELKMVELGLLTHPSYRFCFVLDKTSMFRVESNKPDGSLFKHQVKPLQIIWSKFAQWNEANTLHVDDLSRNFALNLGNGIKIKAYYRDAPDAGEDRELLWLGRYLVHLALRHEQQGQGQGQGQGEGEEGGMSFAAMDHGKWREEAKKRGGGGGGGTLPPPPPPPPR